MEIKRYIYPVILVVIIIVALVLRFAIPQAAEAMFNLYQTTRNTIWNWVGITIGFAIGVYAMYRFSKSAE